MNQSTTNCLRCGAPMNPPKSGHYNCQFCGAPYFAGGVLARSVIFVKRITQTKGFNSSIVIPVGLGSILLTLLIFRYPSFQKDKVQYSSTPTTQPQPKKPQKILINKPSLDENLIEENKKEKTKESIKSIPDLSQQKISEKPLFSIKPEVFNIPKDTNKRDSNEFKTIIRNELNSIPFRMKIAGTIGFRPSIKTVNFISRRNSTKNIKLNDKSNFYFSQGYEKKLMGDFDGALADYSKAIAINPNDSDLYYFRGWLRANPEIRDFIGATADFEALKRLEPNNVQNLLDLSSAYLRAQYPSKAIKLLDIAQRIEPENGNIVWWKGIFTIKSGKLPAGCKFVREARRMKAADYNPTMLKSCN